MYDRLMVPLDGSRFAESALPLAIRLAQRAGSSVRLVTVAEPFGPSARDCEEYLERLAGRVSEDFTGEVTWSVPAGAIVPGLIEEADEFGADATVMATHGRGGLSRLWLGSVATGFLHETTRPLLLVRPDAADETEPEVPWGFAKLLVPLDGSPLSERVLGHATTFGGLFGAAYHLVKVVSPAIDPGTPYGPPNDSAMARMLEAHRVAAEEYLAARAASIRAAGLTVSTAVVVDAQPGRGILEECAREGCDSIAMATHGRVGLGRVLLGSTADKVARGAEVPILLYRPDDADA